MFCVEFNELKLISSSALKHRKVFLGGLILFISLILSCLTTESHAQSLPRLSPIKLNPVLPATGIVRAFQISPNGQTVVFVARAQSGSADILYSVPISGGTPTRLSSDISGRDAFTDFQITPDGANVVFRGDQNARNLIELFSVPIAGGALTRLNGNLTTNGDVDSFKVSPNSQWVIYFADQETDNVNEIFSSPITGQSNIKLNADATREGIRQFEFEISPNSDRVVFLNDPKEANLLELFSVPIDGGTITQLDDVFLNNIDVDISEVFDFKFTPDGQSVIYRAKEREFLNQALGLDTGLFSTPIIGGASTLLSGVILAGSAYEISNNSSRLIFVGTQIGSPLALFSVDLNNIATPLAIASDNSNSILRFNIDNVSERAVYQFNDFEQSLFSASYQNNPPNNTQLNLAGLGRVNLTDTAEVSGLQAYSTQLGVINVVPVIGGEVERINNEPETLGTPSSIQFNQDGSTLGFKVGSQIFARNLNASQTFIVNAQLISGGATFDYQFNSVGDRIVYRADQETDGKIELYSVQLPEPEPPISGSDESFCFPIKASNASIAVICL